MGLHFGLRQGVPKLRAKPMILLGDSLTSLGNFHATRSRGAQNAGNLYQLLRAARRTTARKRLESTVSRSRPLATDGLVQFSKNGFDRLLAGQSAVLQGEPYSTFENELQPPFSGHPATEGG